MQGGWDSELFFGAINEQLGPDYLAEVLPSYKEDYVTIASNDVLLKSYQQFARNEKFKKFIKNG
ncbi:MAG: hypothetical protein Ct9H90mP22_8410 [Gammaproteobacteria bacterium]|nr:MAG: hypothetical protein Ct9H90mP22_8410 [Gammaproteobacteria bacterium]